MVRYGKHAYKNRVQ